MRKSMQAQIDELTALMNEKTAPSKSRKDAA